jgi:hypothetical protein
MGLCRVFLLSIDRSDRAGRPAYVERRFISSARAIRLALAVDALPALPTADVFTHAARLSAPALLWVLFRLRTYEMGSIGYAGLAGANRGVNASSSSERGGMSKRVAASHFLDGIAARG